MVDMITLLSDEMHLSRIDKAISYLRSDVAYGNIVIKRWIANLEDYRVRSD